MKRRAIAESPFPRWLEPLQQKMEFVSNDKQKGNGGRERGGVVGGELSDTSFMQFCKISEVYNCEKGEGTNE